MWLLGKSELHICSCVAHTVFLLDRLVYSFPALETPKPPKSMAFVPAEASDCPGAQASLEASSRPSF